MLIFIFAKCELKQSVNIEQAWEKSINYATNWRSRSATRKQQGERKKERKTTCGIYRLILRWWCKLLYGCNQSLIIWIDITVVCRLNNLLKMCCFLVIIFIAQRCNRLFCYPSLPSHRTGCHFVSFFGIIFIRFALRFNAKNGNQMVLGSQDQWHISCHMNIPKPIFTTR